MPMTSEMLGERSDGRKDQPVRVHSAFRGFRTKIAFDQLVRLEQPQYAAGNRAQQTHPDIEKCRRDLVTIVEAAKHEPPFWQCPILPRRRSAYRFTPSVVRLIAAGKMDQPFRKEGLLAAWHNEGVDDDIVDEIRPHGSGIAEVAHLHRRRAIG